MKALFSGQCMCGAVRYECTAEPRAMYNCHCHVCRHTSGAPYCALLIVPSGAVVIAGSPQHYSVPAKDGSDHVHSVFCGTCGTPMFARSEVRPDILLIKAATLADAIAGAFRPSADIWTASAQPWVAMDTHIPKVHKAPPILQPEASPEVP